MTKEETAANQEAKEKTKEKKAIVPRLEKHVSFSLKKIDYELIEGIALKAGYGRKVKAGNGPEITKGDVNKYFEKLALEKVEAVIKAEKAALKKKLKALEERG